MKYPLLIFFTFSFYFGYSQNDPQNDSWNEFDDVITQLQSFFESDELHSFFESDELQSLFDQLENSNPDFLTMPIDTFLFSDSLPLNKLIDPNQLMDPNTQDYSELQRLLESFGSDSLFPPSENIKKEEEVNGRTLKRI